MTTRAGPDFASLLAELKRLIVAECDMDIDAEELEDEGQLIGGGRDLDSLDALQISMAVKQRYGVRIEGGPDGRRALASPAALARFILEARR